jgi:hypothetical protein
LFALSSVLRGRRFLELEEKVGKDGMTLEVEEILADLLVRDEADSTRHALVTGSFSFHFVLLI